MQRTNFYFAILLTALITCAANVSTAQRRGSGDGRGKKAGGGGCPRAYIGFSTGINNLNGFLGPNVDVAVSPSVSIGAGVGFSTWGTKGGLEARYYFSPARCNRGWAVGAGITHSTGRRDAELELQVVGSGDNTRTVLLELEPKSNFFVAGYHFFRLGRRNRFHLSLGYSLPLSETGYKNKSPYRLTEASDLVVRTLSPGGVIIGLGFSFGAGRM